MKCVGGEAGDVARENGGGRRREEELWRLRNKWKNLNEVVYSALYSYVHVISLTTYGERAPTIYEVVTTNVFL